VEVMRSFTPIAFTGNSSIHNIFYALPSSLQEIVIDQFMRNRSSQHDLPRLCGMPATPERWTTAVHMSYRSRITLAFYEDPSKV
jgi:hypothetical protein